MFMTIIYGELWGDIEYTTHFKQLELVSKQTYLEHLSRITAKEIFWLKNKFLVSIILIDFKKLLEVARPSGRWRVKTFRGSVSERILV